MEGVRVPVLASVPQTKVVVPFMWVVGVVRAETVAWHSVQAMVELMVPVFKCAVCAPTLASVALVTFVGAAPVAAVE